MIVRLKRSPWTALVEAFLLAEVCFAVLLWLVPDSLSSAPSNVIGMPAYFNFNIDKRFYLFYLQALLVPALTALFFSLRHRASLPFVATPAPAVAKAGWEWLRTFFLGSALAVATFRYPPILTNIFLLQVCFFGAAYTALVFCFKSRISQINTLVAPLIFFLPAIASSVTVVHSEVGDFPLPTWFPVWLSAGLAVAAYAWIARGWKKDPTLERKALLYFVCPTLLFTLKAEILSIHTLIDFTHDGEYLVSGNFFAKGLFPWRDFNLVRGVLGECLRPWLGFSIFGNSIWGAKAGESLIWQPLLYVFRYFLILYVTRGNLLLVFVAAFVLQEPHPQLFSLGYIPLMLQPLLWLSFFELLRRKTLGWAIGFASFAFLYAFISLEAAMGILATSLVLLFADRKLFRQTSLTYLAWFAAAALFLDAHHALSPFLRDFAASISARRFVHGYPVEWWLGPEFCFGVFLPVLSIFYVFTRLFLKKKQGRDLSHWDWGMAGVALFVLLAYQKFLSTPDGHLWEITAECLPIVLWAVLPLFRYRWTYAAVAGIVILTYPHSPARRLQELTHQYERFIDRPSSLEKIGLLGAAPTAEMLVRDFSRVFDGRIGPGETVYDLTNSKGLFYYLLGLTPLDRFSYTGHQLAAQEEVLEAMKRNPPKLVVYSGGRFWNQGGIPNSVRYWAVSEYLLEHYEPLVVMHSYLILQRKSAAESSPSLYSFVPGCDWGYAPFLFRTPRAGKSVGISSTEVELTDKDAIRALDIDFDESIADEIVLKSAGKGEIRFKTAEGGPSTIRLNVASCPQWKLFSGSRVFLEHAGGQKIAGVSVIKK